MCKSERHMLGPACLVVLAGAHGAAVRLPAVRSTGVPRRHCTVIWCAATADTRVEAILFDADGTLLNSLPPHVAFCRMLNDERELGLQLPEPTDVAGCRRIAAAPMANFFRAAGFPEATIQQCVVEYESRFATECPVVPFAGVDALLARLAGADVRCAVVSSNTAANVRAGLGPALSARLEFIDGIDNAPADKTDAIASALARLAVEPAAAVYVGDTRKDCVKANAAGVPFLGVDYGFEDLKPDLACDALASALGVVSSVGALEALLCDGLI